jgi:tetratricopeptide (TPR) repeat protein
MAKPPKKKRSAATRPAERKKPQSRPVQADRGDADIRARLDKRADFAWRDRTDLIHMGVVLVVALVLRMLFFYFNQKNNPVFYFPIMDALYHNDWAHDILAGGTWAADDVYFRGPLYPYLLAFLYKISGSSIAFAAFVQHVMGTLSAGLCYLLAREYFSRRVSLVAALGLALYWPIVYFEGELLIVTLIIFVNTLTFLAFAKAARRHNVWLYVVAGLLLGISTVARPSILAFYPAVPLFIWLTAKRAPSGTPGWVRRFVYTGVACAIVIAPFMVRNYVVGKAVVPVAASGGVNFYIGNNPASDGSTAIVPGTRADWWGGFEDAVAIAERDEGRKLRLAEVSSYYYGRGLDFFADRPGEAWGHMFKKLRLFWAGPERANNKFIYFFWHLAGFKYVPLPAFWLVAPFGLLGAVVLWPRRRELSIFYLFLLTYMLGVVAFFVNARFRLPVVPILLLFAAYGAAYIVDAFRQKNLRLAQAILVLAVAMVLVNHDYMWVREMRAYSNAISHNSIGNAYLKMGLGDTALEHFQLAYDINEESPTPPYELIARDVNYNLGLLLWERGLCSRAVEVLRQVSGTDQYALNAMDYLGDCYLKRSQLQEAINVYNRFMLLAPNDSRAITGLARCRAANGELEIAYEMLTSVVDPTGSVYAPTYIALAEVQRGLGKIDEAIESYTHIARYSGHEKDALLALAQLYVQKGDKEAAIRTLQTARNYFPPNDPTIGSLITQIRSGP